MPRSEIVVMMVVLLLSVFWNLVYAVGIGLVLASLIFMKKIGDVSAKRSKLVPLNNADELKLPWKDEVNFPPSLTEEVFIKRLYGPLFFGNTSDFQELATGIPDTATHLIIRMGRVPYLDQSGLYALEETLLRLTRRGVKVILISLQAQPRVMMESIDIIPDLVPEKRLKENFKDAMVYIRENVDDVV